MNSLDELRKRWAEVAIDIREGICTFAVLTKTGIQPELIQFGWRVPVGTDGELLCPEFPYPQIVVQVVNFRTWPQAPPSWSSTLPEEEATADANARLHDALERWNSLPDVLRDEAVAHSWARVNLAHLLAAIRDKTDLRC